MRVLLDEMLPIGVRDLLPGHEVVTAAFAGLAGVSNGELIRSAIANGFDVDRIRTYVDRVHQAIMAAEPGSVIEAPTDH